MEDKKLMKNKNIFNRFTSKKRKGFALPLALCVVAIGLLIITFMFDSVSSFTRHFSEYRQVYVDTITARSYIERVKGEIVAVNNSRVDTSETVLHGPENIDPELMPEITTLDGLLIANIANNGGTFQINENISVNGPQRVEVRVYDANYNVEKLVPDFPMNNNMNDLPPSFLVEGGVGPSWSKEATGGEHYNPEDEIDEGKVVAYRDYGAYLIRVRIYDLANQSEKLVRTTEEAFLQRIR